MNIAYPVLAVAQAQRRLPKLCQEGKPILITRRDRPVSVLLPIEDYEAMMETLDLLSNPKAMKILRAAKRGKLSYKRLDLKKADFGL